MSRVGRPNVLIAAVQVPFTRGGAEILVDKLRQELAVRDFNVDVVQLPFQAQPKEKLLDQMALWRALDLTVFNGRKVDLVICTKFPSYLLSHPNKVLWLVHQHRQLYDLYGTRFGDFTSGLEDEALRRMVVQADLTGLRECQALFTISQNVTVRLQRYLELESLSLPPPLPLGNRYFHGKRGDYILSVGRICSIKRVDLIIKALPGIPGELKLKIVGVPDEPAIDTYLRSEIDKHHLWNRVEFLGRVTDDELLQLYANCFAVYYAPFDEDYGFVTLEALASGKPVITANDSGGVLEFVRDEENGLVVESSEQAMGQAFSRLWSDLLLYDQLVRNALASEKILDWDFLIGQLTATLVQKSEGELSDDGERTTGELVGLQTAL